MNIKVILVLSVLGTCGLISSSLGAQNNPSHFDVLAAKYAASGNATLEGLEGGYLGRCFHESNDTPVDNVLTTKRFVVASDGGPLFPAVTTWKSVYLNGVSPAGTTRIQDQQFWSETGPNFGSAVGEASVVNGVVTGTVHNLIYETKLGSDHFLYGRASETDGDSPTVTEYCYFYKKLY